MTLADMVLGAALVLIGIVVVLGGRWIGGAINASKAEQTGYSSLLSQDAIERLQRMYRSPESLLVTTYLVRMVGAFLVAAGVGAIISSLG